MTSSFNAHAFPEAERRGVYAAMYRRRDIRHFRPDPIPAETLANLLDAAHHAGSVGFMQPWNFIVIQRLAAAQFFDEPRRSQYLSLKLEGILEAPVNVCVTCDPTRAGPAVLGRNSIPETDIYSTCCAVQNLWLAARAEGVGMGWVSILKVAHLREILGLPSHVIPVAYLCLGYVEEFPDGPVLEKVGWRKRMPLAELVFFDRWGQRATSACAELKTAIQQKEKGSSGMKRILETISAIPPLDEAAMTAARARQDTLTKPPHSLGRLEELSIQLAGITGQPRPRVERKAVIAMAGDHGVTAEGVSAYPAEVTPQMVLNFVRGGAAINVLARQAGARVVVVDVGVAADLDPQPGLELRKVARGTQNMALGPAMTYEQTVRAIEVGIEIVEAEIAKGLDLVATGDMGIGNTTPSAAIVAAITGRSVAQVTGRGTGVDDAGLVRKVAVIERALALNQPDPRDPFDVLMKVGGLEIAGLVGVILGAAAHRIPVVVDGFISGAAALVAAGLAPQAKPFLIAGHQSVEIGHRVMLEHLGLRPLLDLDLRLGEGTGAALAFHLIEAAARILDEMATFGEAGVSDRQ
ncbi:MAG: nicotinate-nucleotide--dimethylbenzimidazole phosphoribosyltransferase [Chloroflexi bacterium]|nr:nicotinate-nucleotide--dimethylbenzimidazole phosphoribosyltransferase [Chloroflexota bacterium]